MSHDHDENLNESPNEHLQEVLARGTRTPLNRRNLIRGGVGLAALSSLPFLAACGGGGDAAPAPAPAPAAPNNRALGFSAIDKSLLDDVILLELAWPAVATEAEDYRDFCAYRNAVQPQGDGTQRREAWVRERLDALALYQHHARVNARRYVQGGSPERPFRVA